MAQIILNGADFSARNIGKMPVPFSALTEQTLAMFGITKNTGDSLQMALNYFLNKLSEAGLWGTKIKSLCLPFLSEIAQGGSLAYAQKDVVSGNNFFSDNISGSLALYQHGLKAVIGDNPVVYANFKNVANVENYHVGAFDVTPETDDELHSVKVVFGGAFGYNDGGLCLMKSLGSPVKMYPANYVASNNTVYAYPEEYEQGNLILAQFDRVSAELCYQSVFYKGALYSKTNGAYSSHISTNPRLFRLSGNNYVDGSTTITKVATASIGLLSIGAVLTEQECIVYENTAKYLMQAVKNYTW